MRDEGYPPLMEVFFIKNNEWFLLFSSLNYVDYDKI